jgi:hypothetical protein
MANEFSMPFTNQNSSKFDVRPRLTKLAQSDIGNLRFEQSEGIRPAEYFGVYKYLPVQNKDINTEDYVVIPKGRIVASLSTEDSTVTGRIVYPSASGSIYIGKAASELGGASISASIDSSFYGYSEFITGLLVPANGGTACSGFYTSDDVSAGALMSNGATAVAGSGLVLPVNAPIGVAFHDWYQDINGKYLNYRLHADGGHILTDWYVEVPYVKVSNSSYSGVNPQYQNTYANTNTWREINKKFTYMTVDTVNSDVFRTGVFVQSDLIGNYKIQGGASSMTQNKTVQTVGKILSIDNRFPKGGMEDVLTYPRSGMPGTQTAGLPKNLFDFTYKCIEIGTGVAPTIEGVYNAVRSGAFGLVRIQLLVS